MNSYAKINLHLQVLGTREDGYHQIKTVFHEIELCDVMSFTPAESVKVTMNVGDYSPHFEVPPREDNIVYQAALLMINKYQVNQGVHIHIDKNIPISAGLGGGSSNAATAIKALSSLWNLNIDNDEMTGIANRIGSDVAFFLSGGTALGEGRGEIINSIGPRFYERLLLVKPPFGISSREAYNLYSESVAARPDNNPGEAGLERDLLLNQLEQPLRSKYKDIDNIITFMKGAGAAEAMLSGSGSTVIGFYNDDATFNRHYDHFNKDNYWVKKTRSRIVDTN